MNVTYVLMTIYYNYVILYHSGFCQGFIDF